MPCGQLVPSPRASHAEGPGQPRMCLPSGQAMLGRNQLCPQPWQGQRRATLPSPSPPSGAHTALLCPFGCSLCLGRCWPWSLVATLASRLTGRARRLLALAWGRLSPGVAFRPCRLGAGGCVWMLLAGRAGKVEGRSQQAGASSKVEARADSGQSLRRGCMFRG